jgi:16S rRNA processing protein RimM
MPAGTDGSSADRSAPRWLAVARLLRPQGRRGEILAEPLTDRAGAFASNQQFRLELPPPPGTLPVSASRTVACTLESTWAPQGRNAGRLVLQLTGVTSISEAEALQGATLEICESSLPPLDPDTFQVSDLLGCTLLDGEEIVGTVVDLQFPIGPDGRTRLPDAADLLAVERTAAPPEAEPVLIPFVKAWLHSVDLPGKRILMHLPLGLLE